MKKPKSELIQFSADEARFLGRASASSFVVAMTQKFGSNPDVLAAFAVAFISQLISDLGISDLFEEDSSCELS